MTTEPTVSRDWAALNTDLVYPTSGHGQAGWNTSNGLITGTPEKPSFLLNGWHGVVSDWLNWMYAALREDSQELGSYSDMWEWDTADITGIDGIDAKGGRLRWRKVNAGIGAVGFWSVYIDDMKFGGMYWEAIDILNKGLGIKIIDSSADEWMVYTLTNIPPTDFILLGNQNTGVNAEFHIPSTADNSGIRIYKNGLLVPNFNGFGTIADLSINNPNGIRIVMPGSVKYQDRIVAPNGKTYLMGMAPRKRWIRPMLNTGTTPTTVIAFQFPTMVRGRKYRLWVNVEATGGFGAWEAVIGFALANPSQKIVEISGLSANGYTEMIEQEFVFEDSGIGASDFGIRVAFGTSTMINPSVADIDVQYADGSFFGNYLVLEELNV